MEDKVFSQQTAGVAHCGKCFEDNLNGAKNTTVSFSNT